MILSFLKFLHVFRVSCKSTPDSLRICTCRPGMFSFTTLSLHKPCETFVSCFYMISGCHWSGRVGQALCGSKSCCARWIVVQLVVLQKCGTFTEIVF